MKSLKDRVMENYRKLGTKDGFYEYGVKGGTVGVVIAKYGKRPREGFLTGVAGVAVLPLVDAVMDYMEDSQMAVHIFDFIHTETERDFRHFTFRLRNRLQDEWRQMLDQTGFEKIEFFGGWDFTPYDKDASMRLIAVAEK